MIPSLDKCVDDALTKLKPETFFNEKNEPIHSNSQLEFSQCEIFAWTQIWEDAGCGQSGIWVQAITGGTTLVVLGPMKDACVYHNGKFAYLIDKVDNVFWELIDRRYLPTQWNEKKVKEKENVTV